MENKFSIGDLVKLKSGGPDMVVHNMEHELGVTPDGPFNGYIICKWIDDNKQPHSEVYHQDSLVSAG